MARLLCRGLTLQNEYRRLEDRTLKEKVSARIRFAEEERRPLMRMSSARETALKALWGADEFSDTMRSLVLRGTIAEPAFIPPEPRRWVIAQHAV